MRHAVAISLLLLAGCAGPAMNGNARGGMIEWFGTSHRQVWAMANAHCARYGKSAHITQVFPRAGGHVLFECK